LKPVNLLKSTLKDITSSPYLIDNILGTTIDLATGYLSKKLVVRASGNIQETFPLCSANWCLKPYCSKH